MKLSQLLGPYRVVRRCYEQKLEFRLTRPIRLDVGHLGLIRPTRSLARSFDRPVSRLAHMSPRCAGLDNCHFVSLAGHGRSVFECFIHESVRFGSVRSGPIADSRVNGNQISFLVTFFVGLLGSERIKKKLIP